MGKIKSNAIVGQSGGPTSAINATLVGVILGALGNVNKLYGMQNGIQGILDNNLVELNHLFRDERSLSLLEGTPGAMLGSCRVRLPADLDSVVYKEIFERLDQYGIEYFFYIGGNDSMDTVAKLNAYSKKTSAGVSVIGIPKTVDNDLVQTDHTPGYGSAAKCIASTVCELWQDVSSYNLPSVTILEVMGRDTGWLGCACALPQYVFGYGCSLVYLPEAEFSVDGFMRDVESALHFGKPLLVGVSEGIGLSGNNSADAFGNRNFAGAGRVLEDIVRSELKCKVRTVELSLAQRCAAHLASGTDICESVRIGKSSVEMALSGKSGKMSAFVRHTGTYGVDIVDVDAYSVANKTKYVPRDFINSEGNFVTDKCIEYLSPLISGERKTRQAAGLPCHYRLR